MLISRLLIVGIFVMSTFGKITGFAVSAEYAVSSWIPLPGELLIIAAILMEVFGVIALVSGWKFKEGSLILAFYTFLTIIMFHIGESQAMNMLKNMAIIGELLAMSMLKPEKYAIKEQILRINK
jgi:putative oxidoreductase